MRERGFERIEARRDAVERWVDHVNKVANATLLPQAKNSWYLGANIPGKPRVFMPYAGGMARYRETCAAVAVNGYEGFALMGKTRVEVSRMSEVSQEMSDRGSTGRTPAIELHDLLTADEISRNFARGDRLKRQLVIWAGFDPMILQRVEYFDRTSPHFPAFRGRYSENH